MQSYTLTNLLVTLEHGPEDWNSFGLGFQHLPRDLANVNAWKTMFDPCSKALEGPRWHFIKQNKPFCRSDVILIKLQSNSPPAFVNTYDESDRKTRNVDKIIPFLISPLIVIHFRGIELGNWINIDAGEDLK